jgi:hypothetical protein
MDLTKRLASSHSSEQIQARTRASTRKPRQGSKCRPPFPSFPQKQRLDGHIVVHDLALPCAERGAGRNADALLAVTGDEFKNVSAETCFTVLGE